MAIGGEPNGPLPPVDEHLHIVEDVGVELAGQIAKRHAALRHPVGVPKRVHAIGESKGRIGLLGGNDAGGRAVDAVGAQMHAIADDQDQGRPVHRPVPVGQEGRAGTRMCDLRRNSGGRELENSHGDVFLFGLEGSTRAGGMVHARVA